MKPVRAAVAVLTATLFAAPLAADEDPMVVQINRMSLETATGIAKAAIDACRKQGIQIGVTVVDRDGVPQAVMRDTIAPTITLPISEGKAYAAVMFNVPTSDLKDRAGTPIGRVPGVVMSAGGLPIQVGGALLGGVGVSGAPSGETDQQCAQAGVDAVSTDLEMSM
ncbi:MAG: heme-binding protein [Gammaproteobacteria bacterium]|nr:heme-binding protein [Gammaproteobacteria bacterium]